MALTECKSSPETIPHFKVGAVDDALEDWIIVQVRMMCDEVVHSYVVRCDERYATERASER